jgi:hypothetical protein
MKEIASIVTICGLAALPGLAQTSRFTGQIGGGFTNPLGNLGARLDSGWNVTAGAGVNANSHLGLMLDFNFNNFGITRTELNRLQVPDGSTPLVSLASHRARLPNPGPCRQIARAWRCSLLKSKEVIWTGPPLQPRPPRGTSSSKSYGT